MTNQELAEHLITNGGSFMEETLQQYIVWYTTNAILWLAGWIALMTCGIVLLKKIHKDWNEDWLYELKGWLIGGACILILISFTGIAFNLSTLMAPRGYATYKLIRTFLHD